MTVVVRGDRVAVLDSRADEPLSNSPGTGFRLDVQVLDPEFPVDAAQGDKTLRQGNDVVGIDVAFIGPSAELIQVAKDRPDFPAFPVHGDAFQI